MKMTLRLAAAVAAVLTFVPATSAQQGQPEGSHIVSAADVDASPAVKRLKELLAVLKAGDVARIKAYVMANAAQPGPGPVAATLGLYHRTRGLDLLRVTKVEGSSAVAVLRSRLTGDEEGISVEVEPQAPHRFTGMGPASFEPVGAQGRTSEKEQFRQIGTYLKRLGEAEVFSGVVVIARNGRPVFSQAYGYADREKKIANTVDTPFLLGSMNKLFTGLAIGQLVEQGKLTYDDPLSKFIPDYPDAESAKRIKIKHLLSHTSGLPSFNPAFSPPGNDTVRVETVLTLVPRKPVQFEPGSKWSYSNTGIQLLGRVIEVVTGQDYYDYVRKNVYARGGMKRDPFPDYSNGAVAIALPYEIDWSETEPRWTDQMAKTTRRGGPAGGGIASANDLISLGYAMDTGRIVKPTTLRLHSSPKPEFGTEHYGYAFSVQARMAKRPLVGHGGNALGQCTEFGALADTPYTIVVLSNLTASTCMAVTGKILKVLQPTKTSNS